MRKMRVQNPRTGGLPIPERLQGTIRDRILKHAEKNYAGKYTRIDVRFHGKFCYIDAYTEPFVPENYDPNLYGESREEHIERLRNIPFHLCRLRFFDIERWSLDFYTYSNEKYEPCIFDNGSFTGTVEEAFDTSAVYLQE